MKHTSSHLLRAALDRCLSPFARDHHRHDLLGVRARTSPSRAGHRLGRPVTTVACEPRDVTWVLEQQSRRRGTGAHFSSEGVLGRAPDRRIQAARVRAYATARDLARDGQLTATVQWPVHLVQKHEWRTGGVYATSCTINEPVDEHGFLSARPDTLAPCMRTVFAPPLPHQHTSRRSNARRRLVHAQVS